MTRHLHGLLVVALAAVIYGAPAQAAQPANSGVQVVRAADLGAAGSRVRSNPTGVVKQRAAYGQGYIYGRSVNNQSGDIVVWNAAPSYNYGKSPPVKAGIDGRPRAGTAIGPKLTYKPAYGKTTKSSFAQ